MNRLKVSYISGNFQMTDFENKVWLQTAETGLHSYWSGAPVEFARQAKARIVWNDEALFVRFEGNQREPLIINNKPDTTKKSIGLWERDVFEIFVAPDVKKPEKYFEFEVAPTGEWLDAKIEILESGKRETHFHYNSGMKTAALILEDKIFATIKINWQAFDKKPKESDIWRGNLFRCVGSGEKRGYLAWQPTATETPNFHVPEKFGYFEFVRERNESGNEKN